MDTFVSYSQIFSKNLPLWIREGWCLAVYVMYCIQDFFFFNRPQTLLGRREKGERVREGGAIDGIMMMIHLSNSDREAKFVSISQEILRTPLRYAKLNRRVITSHHITVHVRVCFTFIYCNLVLRVLA